MRKALGAGLLLLALSGFLALFPKFGFGILEHSRSNGGGVGYVIEGTLASALNIIGAAIVLTAASLLTLMLTMEVSFATINSWLRPVMKVLAESAKHFRARWAERTEQRRIYAEQREAERAEERKRLEAEMKEREREKQARLEQLRKLQEEERKRKAEEARRLKEQQPVIAKPIIREPIIKEPIMSSAAVVSPVVATTGAAIIKTEPDSFEDSESEMAEAASATTSTHRQRAAAILRARTAKQEQARSNQSRPSEITMDPEVAEMISTASIVRTVPTETAEQKAAKAQAARKKTIETSSGATYKLPVMDLPKRRSLITKRPKKNCANGPLSLPRNAKSLQS